MVRVALLLVTAAIGGILISLFCQQMGVPSWVGGWSAFIFGASLPFIVRE